MPKTCCKFDIQADVGSVKRPDSAIFLNFDEIYPTVLLLSRSWGAFLLFSLSIYTAMLKVAFVSLEHSFKETLLKKFALAHSRTNRGSSDPCGLTLQNLLEVGPPLLGYFFAGRSYFNKNSLKKQIMG